MSDIVKHEGFQNLIEKRMKNIWSMKAGNITKDMNRWKIEAMTYVMSQETLKPLLSTKEGQASILKCFYDACNIGLSFGGMYPQCYIVPFKNKKKGGVKEGALIPSANGLKTIAMSDPAVISDVVARAVYSNENFTLDYSTGEAPHTFDPMAHSEKGDFVGVYAQVKDTGGKKSVVFMNKKELDALKNKSFGQFWTNFYEQMALKTVVKKALKPYLPLKEALSKVYGFDGEKVAPDDYSEKPIGDRVADSIQPVPVPECADKDDPPEEIVQTAVPTEDVGDIF